ncbi:hypothetical protein NC651_014865 [Populus alba x Populus x berolinensis]|nr:hypothetical protein NC651_014865 [Populus alba x Populus x berolinensis]
MFYFTLLIRCTYGLWLLLRRYIGIKSIKRVARKKGLGTQLNLVTQQRSRQTFNSTNFGAASSV